MYACTHDDDAHLMHVLPRFREFMLAFTSIAAIFGDSKTTLKFHTDPNTWTKRVSGEGRKGEAVFSAQIAISGGVNLRGQCLAFSPQPRRNFKAGSFSGQPFRGIPRRAILALQREGTITAGCMTEVHGGSAAMAEVPGERCTRLFATLYNSQDVNGARHRAADGSKNGFSAVELHVLEKLRSNFHRRWRKEKYGTGNARWPAAKAELTRLEAEHDRDRALRREAHVRGCPGCRHVRALASSGARSISHVVGNGIDKDGRRVSGEIEVLAAARDPTALRAMAGIVGVQW